MKFSYIHKCVCRFIIFCTLASLFISPLNIVSVIAGSPIIISTDWSKVISTTNSESFGINGQGAMVLDWGTNPQYIANLKNIQPQFVRFHDSIQQDSSKNWRAWANYQTKSWDKVKIREFANMIRKWRANGVKSNIVITLSSYPNWFKKKQIKNSQGVVVSEILDPSEYTGFGNLARDLVAIINKEENLNVTNFEIFNEFDYEYSIKPQDGGAPRQMQELGRLYNHISKSMKSADNRISTGGISFARTNRVEGIREFIETVAPEKNPRTLDYLSYHQYMSGNAADSDTTIYNNAMMYPLWSSRDIKGLLDNNKLFIPIRFYEFNISWSGDSVEPRMINQKGAIFDALALVSAMKSGNISVAPWTDLDPRYGKMSQNYQLRPSAFVWKMLNSLPANLQIVNSKSTNPDIVTFALKSPTTPKRYIFVINHGGVTQNINLGSFAGDAAIKISVLDESQNAIQTRTANGSTLINTSIARNSVNLFEIR